MCAVVTVLMTRPLPVELSWAPSATYISPSVGPLPAGATIGARCLVDFAPDGGRGSFEDQLLAVQAWPRGQTLDMLGELNFQSNSVLVFSQRSNSSWGKDGLCFLLRLVPNTHTQKTLSAWNQPPHLTVARSGMNPVPYLHASHRTSAVCLSLFKKKIKDPQRQSSLPGISQAVKYSRRHFCSDSIKGLPPYPPLYSHSQPAPSGEGWRL